MIKLETRVVKSEDEKKVILVEYNDDNGSIDELLAVINNVYRRLREKGIDNELIVKQMIKEV